MSTLGPPPQINDVFGYSVSPGLGGYGGTLDGVTQGDKVVAISADGTNYSSVNANDGSSQETTVDRTYLSFGAFNNGDDNVDPIPDSQTVIDAINANDGNANPIGEKFYYQVSNDAGTTTDTLTYNLNDIDLSNSNSPPFSSPETVQEGDRISVAGLSAQKALSSGEMQSQGDQKVYSVTVSSFDFDKQTSNGIFSIDQSLPGDVISYNNDHTSVTITGTQADINQDLQSLHYTAADVEGNNAILFSAVDGNETTPTFVVGNIDVVCYCTGTLIRTPRGDIAVEDLAIGDVVVTSSGAERPIKWIGHQDVDCRNHPKPLEAMPVCVSAGALAPNRPERDLWVSPGHAICLDMMGEVLLTAGSLVNGATITQIGVERVTYWHVELESHDLLIANGMPAESFLDMGNRAFLATGEGPIDPKRGPGVVADFCRPMHYDGPLVDAARMQLRARAKALGWQVVPRAPWDGVHLEVDGEVVLPVTRGLGARFALPSDARKVVLVSPIGVPAHVKNSADRRTLGLGLAALAIDDGFDAPRTIALDDGRLSEGFHKAEADHRWTNGRARLPSTLWAGIDGTLSLSVTLRDHALPELVAPEGSQRSGTMPAVEAPVGLRLVHAA